MENESSWYYTNKPNRWPALGRGYNTGVMLLDLKKIRTTTDWTRLWRDAVNDNIKRLNHTTLADQDVINAIIKNQPRFVYDMSCQYNVQMSTTTLAKNCYGENKDNVKVSVFTYVQGSFPGRILSCIGFKSIKKKKIISRNVGSYLSCKIYNTT